MRKLNNKGFTLIEITTAILILGILMLIAMGALTTYMDQSRKKAYDNMARSASNAAEEYIMDQSIGYIEDPDGALGLLDAAIDSETNEAYEYSDIDTDPNYILKNSPYYVTYKELVEEGYLSDTTDPANSAGQCSGKVVIYHVPAKEEEGILDKFSYVVYEWCSGYKARYIFHYKEVMEKRKVKVGDEYQEIEVEVIKPISTITKKKQLVGNPPEDE